MLPIDDISLAEHLQQKLLCLV